MGFENLIFSSDAEHAAILASRAGSLDETVLSVFWFATFLRGRGYKASARIRGAGAIVLIAGQSINGTMTVDLFRAERKVAGLVGIRERYDAYQRLSRFPYHQQFAGKINAEARERGAILADLTRAGISDPAQAVETLSILRRKFWPAEFLHFLKPPTPEFAAA